MSGVRQYLLSIVGCGFISSVLLTLVKLPTVKKLLRLCCGCALILTVSAPLITIHPSDIEDFFAGTELATDYDSKEAERKNMELLAQMIREQTANAIAAQAQTLGCTAEAEVELSVPADGTYPVPERVTVRSACGAREKRALQEYIAAALDIPADRQSWVLP